MYLNPVELHSLKYSSRLRLTWDVFKSNKEVVMGRIIQGLRLTWDVFKWI